MLSPKRSKFRKQFKGRTRGMSKGGKDVSFGDFGLQALEPGWITARQLEAARVAGVQPAKLATSDDRTALLDHYLATADATVR